MPVPLSGPGVGLPYPANLYPSQLQNAPQDAASNQVGLAPGDSLVLPAGDWYIGLGLYLVLQFLDPVTNTWMMVPGVAWTRGMTFISSDGFTSRIANLTGCIVSASVINGGTGYVQATTTITAIGTFGNGAAPTLLPIVGGALKPTGTFTIDVPTKGAGYGVAPIIMIPPPPPASNNANGVGGIPAVAVAIIGSGGSISSVSVVNPGAGYPSAPIAVVVPSPFDPNLNTGITQASVTFSLTSAGVIMGALVTNNGNPLNNGSLASVTLSIGGAGTSGSLTANVLQTVVSGTLSSAGTGYGTTGVGFTTFGGVPVAGTITNNPFAEGLAFMPRPAQIAVTAASVSLAAPATIYDGGLFESAPSFSALGPPVGGLVTIAGLTGIMGSAYDIAIIQPAP
jgi:hypothetical protein